MYMGMRYNLATETSYKTDASPMEGKHNNGQNTNRHL